jgi:pimeloyl-ACP methyl ester carboxylesterase
MPTIGITTGIQLHYEIEGSGDPIVMIPGTGQGGGILANVVQTLRDRFTCISIDNRGAGRSEVTPDGYTIPQMTADAIALIEHLNLGAVHLCGQSMGAMIAQSIAVDRPDLVRTLQLHGTTDHARYPHLRRQLEIRLALVQSERWDIFGPNSVVWLNPPDYVNAHDDELAEQQARFFKNLPNPVSLAGHFAADLAYDSLGRLSEITCPTLITVGSHDITTLPAYGQSVHEQIRHSFFVVIEGGGHLPFLQMPERFNDIVRTFLDQHAPAS